MSIDLNDYKNFVNEVTSEPSKSNDAYMARIASLQNHRTVDIPRLTTAAMGLTAEGGEFTEIVKKLLFQGKPLNDDEIFHMKRELGDVLWYWMQACMALDADPQEIIKMNVEKLEARYPGGFDAFLSENRKEGDL